LKTILSGLVALVCAVAFAAPAEAKLLTFAYTLQVTGVSGTAASRLDYLEPGDLLTGRFTLDTDLTDDIPEDPAAGYYSYDWSPLPKPVTPVVTLDLGGTTLKWFDVTLVVVDKDNDPYIPEDLIIFGISSVAFEPTSDIASASFSFLLHTAQNFDAVIGDGVPTRIPVDLFESNLSDPIGIDFTDGTYAVIDYQPIDIQPIPEPSSLLLMASGFAGAAYIARLRR
jgi:hypothetical protein